MAVSWNELDELNFWDSVAGRLNQTHPTEISGGNAHQGGEQKYSGYNMEQMPATRP